MVTITQNVSALDEVIHVSTPLAAGQLIKIDSEIMRAVAYIVTDNRIPRSYRDKHVWEVARAKFATARATHTSGATVTLNPSLGGSGDGVSATDGLTTVDPATSIQFPAGTLADLGGGVAGVGLVMVLKTYDLTPATSDFVSPSDLGTLLFAIPAGSLCLAQVMQTGDSDQGGTIQLTADDGSGDQDLGVFARIFGAASQSDWSIPSEQSINYPVSGGFATPSGYQFWFEAVDGCNLYASFTPSGTPPSQGNWRVYAIIATPAA